MCDKETNLMLTINKQLNAIALSMWEVFKHTLAESGEFPFDDFVVKIEHKYPKKAEKPQNDVDNKKEMSSLGKQLAEDAKAMLEPYKNNR